VRLEKYLLNGSLLKNGILGKWYPKGSTGLIPGSGNISNYERTLERRGTLIDPQKKRRSGWFAELNIKNCSEQESPMPPQLIALSARSAHRADFLLILTSFLRPNVSIEDDAIQEAQLASLGAWFQSSR